MSSLSDFLYSAARRCRLIGQSTYELGVKGDLRQLADEMDRHAKACEGTECENEGGFGDSTKR
jgi:hypothetical protein